MVFTDVISVDGLPEYCADLTRMFSSSPLSNLLHSFEFRLAGVRLREFLALNIGCDGLLNSIRRDGDRGQRGDKC